MNPQKFFQYPETQDTLFNSLWNITPPGVSGMFYLNQCKEVIK
jgi:hypothetical protein